MTPATLQLLDAAKHMVKVLHSLADRGHYPQELLTTDLTTNKPSPLFMGKHGFSFLTDAIRAVEKEDTDPYRAWVGVMKTSAGIDYYVCVGNSKDYLTPALYKIRGRAEYDVAEWNHLLGQGPEPNLLDYDTDPTNDTDSA